MIIAALSVGLRLYAADSLKEKRFVLASVKRRLRNRFNVSLAEVGGHERWRWAELSLVIVGIDRKTVDREINAVSTFLDRDVRFEVVEREVEYL